jgi:hypothetical protein
MVLALFLLDTAADGKDITKRKNVRLERFGKIIKVSTRSWF